jgi:hypothetical protein
MYPEHSARLGHGQAAIRDRPSSTKAGFFIVGPLQTLFDSSKQCLEPKNNVLELFSLLGRRKHCLSRPNIVLRIPTMFQGISG